MIEIELERTFLAKKLPDGLEKCRSKEILDIYVPEIADHPTLRIRKNGEKYDITKKVPVKDSQVRFEEQTIKLTEDEFYSFNKLKGKRVRKIRYYYPYKEIVLEIDVFQDALKGLVLVDAEFADEEALEKFEVPDFCLVEVNHEEAIAGGYLAGKTYAETEPALKKYGYKKIN
ncbi:MAG: hypothetical protein ACP5N3_05175 [Candidatus Nanoarchaeia archaeon]